MNGREFLNVARAALEDPDEEWQRTATGRAYYALFLECRDALGVWGFSEVSIYQEHSAIRNRLMRTKHADLKELGRALEKLHDARVHADYDLATAFISSFQVEQKIDLAEECITLLDEIEAEPAKRAAAIAALQGVP